MMMPDRKGIGGQAFRFVIAGGLNTLVTMVLLSGLSLLIDPTVAYTIVFAIGIVISVWTAGRFVFRVRMAVSQIVLYVVMYSVVYLVGLLVIQIAEAFGVPEAYTGLVVLVTAPLTFIGGRLLLIRGKRDHARGRALADQPSNGNHDRQGSNDDERGV